MILHHMPMSPFGDKIMRLLNYKGLSYELQQYSPGSQQVKKFNPTGKLPCLQHGEQWLGDSTDIAHQLEQQYPQQPVIPSNATERAQVHILEDWADESLYFYEMHLRFALPENSVSNVPRMMANNGALSRWFLTKIFPRAIHSITKNQGIGKKTPEQIKADLLRHYNAVDGLLEQGPWLVGDTLTLADISVFVMFNCFKDSEQGVECLQRYEKVSDWMLRVDEATNKAQ
ncbi:MAG: glutathione S-transferase [Bacteroidia bacterium]|jgi:glutathione S-transferase